MSIRSSIPNGPRWRRAWKPATGIAAGITALIAWFEEIIAIAVEFIGVIFIFIMTGAIYLFNIYVFKSATPKADNPKQKQR